MGWLSAVGALARLFGVLSGLYRDWRFRNAGAKEDRLAALEAIQRHSKRPAEIEAKIAGLSDDVLRRRMRQYRRARGRVRTGQADPPGGRRQGNDGNDAGATRS